MTNPTTKDSTPATPANRMGVRGYLFLVIAASAVVPVAVAGGFQANRWADADAATADRVALAVATSLSMQLAQEMLGHVRSVEVLAAQIQSSGVGDRERTHEAMRIHAMGHPECTGVLVLDPDGISLAATDSRTGRPWQTGISYADRDYFQRVRATRQTAISPEVTLGRISGVLNIHLGAPVITRDGSLMAVVVSSVDVGPIASEARAVASGLGDGRLVVVDAERHLIADSAAQATVVPDGMMLSKTAPPRFPPLRDLSGFPMFGASAAGRELRLGHDDQGREVRAAVVPLSFAGLGWQIVALRTVASIQHQSAVVRFETALFTLAALLGAIGLAALVAAWLARPVRALARHAERIGQGELGHMPEPMRSGPREMATLTNAVRGMLQRLGAHAENLEGMVVQRTAELTQANRQLGKAFEALQHKDWLILDDLAQAKLFQEKILPTLPSSVELEWSARYLPLEQVGGDIFDVCELGPGHFRVFVADAVGHGVQASMRTIILKSEYDRLKTLHESPARALQELNRRLVALLPGGEAMCTATCFDILKTPQGAEVRYANAAQNPLLCFANGRVREIYGNGPFLGLSENTWTDLTPVTIGPGEILIAATDGLVEQRNEAGQAFEDQVLSMQPNDALTADDALTSLLDGMHQFRGHRPVADDITLVAIKIAASS